MRKSTANEHQAGIHRNGLSGDFPIGVASFPDRSVAERFQDLLAKEGIFSEIKRQQKVFRVVVDREDQPVASKLYIANKDRFPNRVHSSATLRFDYLIFGITIGLTLGAIAILVLWPDAQSFSVALTFVAICGLSGHLMDRIRIRRLKTGRAWLGIWELLILTTIPCLMYLAARIAMSMVEP